MALLEIRNLHARVAAPGGREILKGVDLTVDTGEGAANRDFAWKLENFRHRAALRPELPGWDAEMTIPLAPLGWTGDASRIRLNAFAILGPEKDHRRFYGLNLPAQRIPHFHLPEHFVPLPPMK